MTNREKVIKQIEADIERANRTGEMLVHVGRKTAKDALALLKEQKAVKPKCKERMGEFVAGLCPTCGTALNNVLNVKACGKCGQAVKWDDRPI